MVINMDIRKMLGILFVILGLIFIIYPLYSAQAVSWIAGICLIVFGFSAFIDAFSMWSIMTHVSGINILLGIFAIFLGILFFYNDFAALSFIVAVQFYLIAFVLIFAGILGLFSGPDTMSKVLSALILIVGIIAVYCAFVSIAEPLYAAIFVGVCLVLEGISLFTTKVVEA